MGLGCRVCQDCISWRREGGVKDIMYCDRPYYNILQCILYYTILYWYIPMAEGFARIVLLGMAVVSLGLEDCATLSKF